MDPPRPGVPGRAPYGYRVVRPGRPGEPARLRPDPVTAPVVARIFRDYAAGYGLHAIAEALTAERVPRPSAYDPVRNPHHTGVAWSKAAVRAILTNVRYTGRPAATEVALLRAVAAEHEALVDPADFCAVQGMLASRRHAVLASAPREYAFRGLLRCAQCMRLMQGTWNNDAPYYRCRFPRAYASSHGITHPPSVYLREDRLVEPLRGWLATHVPVDHLLQAAGRYSPEALRRAREFASAWKRAVHGGVGGHERAAVFRALGLRLVYAPDDRLVRVRTSLSAKAMVAEGVVAV